MALETLAGVEEIGGFKVQQERPLKDDGEIDWPLFDEQRKASPIYIDHTVNMISLRIQDGPIGEHGVNGCQVDTIIHAAKQIIDGLNTKFPSSRNLAAIGYLNLALSALQKRTEERLARGVEGESKA